MEYEWNEEKNKINIRKHGIDFTDIKEIFNYPMLTALDTRQKYGEERWIGIGILRNIMVVVIFAEINNNTIRIISERKATKNEREMFKKAIKY